jgi:hypothetical protein
MLVGRLCQVFRLGGRQHHQKRGKIAGTVEVG